MSTPVTLDKGAVASIRTIVEGLILAALVWAGTNLNGLAVEMAKVQTRLISVERLESRVDELEKREAAVEQKHAVLEQRALVNSGRLDRLEGAR